MVKHKNDVSISAAVTPVQTTKYGLGGRYYERARALSFKSPLLQPTPFHSFKILSLIAPESPMSQSKICMRMERGVHAIPPPRPNKASGVPQSVRRGGFFVCAPLLSEHAHAPQAWAFRLPLPLHLYRLQSFNVRHFNQGHILYVELLAAWPLPQPGFLAPGCAPSTLQGVSLRWPHHPAGNECRSFRRVVALRNIIPNG